MIPSAAVAVRSDPNFDRPGAAGEIAVGRQARGAGDPAAAGEEPPLVHVVDHVLVGGQPQPMFWLRLPVHSTVPGRRCASSSGERHDAVEHLADRLGETDPVQASVGKPGDLAAGTA